MNNITCLLFGIILGIIITYITYHDLLKNKDTLIDDYKKSINIHNKRELRLVFIIQSTKDYVRKQLNMTKKYSQEEMSSKIDNYLVVGYYTALKNVENNITQLEKNSKN